MTLGIDHLMSNKTLLSKLSGARIALLANQASLNAKMDHTLDTLNSCDDIQLDAAFGPQHGLKSDKQDNMIETEDYYDPVLEIPVYSLYGKVRRPTKAMMESFDVLIIDIQDLGVRFYTYITTILYLLEACAKFGKIVWILDRPNPIGRCIEGNILEKEWTSFVGPIQIPVRYGLTIGELTKYMVKIQILDLELTVVPMIDYNPHSAPGYGWPLHELSWVNPSPNASSINMARVYPGTALFEGTTLSEGRGTSSPLEMIGCPDIDFTLILESMREIAPQWIDGCTLRHCFFEPVFDKYNGVLCSGIQIHADNSNYKHKLFKPFRLAALILKAIRKVYPDYKLWREFHFEYEKERLAIDLLSGSNYLRKWVDDPNLTIIDFEEKIIKDEERWKETIRNYCLY